MDKEINITLEDISIWLFHKVVTTGDLNLLPVDDNHAQVWEKLVEDFQQEIGKGSNTYLWTLKLQIEMLRYKIRLIDSALKAVYFGAPIQDTKKQLITFLKDNRISVELENKEEYQKHTKVVKSLEVKLKFKVKELESLTPKEDNSKQWDLVKELFTLSRILDLKYKLDPKETSVKEYAVIVKEAQKVVKNGK